MGAQVVVDKLPPCDFCGAAAYVDAVTQLGPWAYMCRPCWKVQGATTQLGTGLGQKLIEREVVGGSNDDQDE